MVETAQDQDLDQINPPHYLQHPSGVECIDITEAFNFNLGNAVKYIWRAGLKTDDPTTDLEKAQWYLARELARIGRNRKPTNQDQVRDAFALFAQGKREYL